MSRSGYTDDWSGDWNFVRWRGAVNSAIRGKRGQAFLQEMIQALDAMPVKRLTKNELQEPPTLLDSGIVLDGPVCALGSVGVKRGVPLSAVDPGDHEKVSAMFGIADALAREIMWLNDEGGVWESSPEERWEYMRQWAASRLQPLPVTPEA